MRIVIAGGTGFLGTALTALLTADRHRVTLLSRHADDAPAPGVEVERWTPDGTSGPWARTIDGADAVVNLSGESIAARRWTAAQKQRILDSRLLATRSLAAAVRAAAQPPRVFVSGSAVGYYGDRGDETITEASAPGADFLASVCRQWEDAAQSAGSLSRVAVIRTGIVLDRHEGALPRMLLPFRMCLGGPLGSGRQYMPWIHRDDWAALVSWTIANDAAHGAINATAPSPVTNAEFSKALGRALRRPAVLPAPAFALRMLLGEMADALLLGGQRALPVRATDLGFRFAHSTIDEALASVLQ